jgi:hypothetical protein
MIASLKCSFKPVATQKAQHHVSHGGGPHCLPTFTGAATWSGDCVIVHFCPANQNALEHHKYMVLNYMMAQSVQPIKMLHKMH